MEEQYSGAGQAMLDRLDLPSILRDLLGNWWMILTAGLAGMMAAWLALELVYTPVYTSTATLLVSARDSSYSTAASDVSAASTMTETFAQLLDSNILKKKVQEDLGLSELPGEITAQVVDNTNLLTVEVSARHPDEAFQVLRGVLDNYDQVTGYVLKNVVLRELDPPTVPTSPSNQVNESRTLQLAAIGCAGAMALVLAVLSYFRDTIKNQDDLAAKLDPGRYLTVYHERKYKSLASRLRREKRAILLTDPTASFLFVETFKKLRTRLLYQAGDRGCQVLLVASVAENEGKSTVAANIALALALKQERVVLIDGDLRRPALYKLLTKPVPPSAELSSFLRGEIPVDDLLLQERKTGLNLILSSKDCQDSTELVSGERMAGLIEAVKGMTDYVVIDTPPMALMADAEVLAEYADVALLVVRQDTSTARQINDAADTLEASHAKLLGCVFNNVRTGFGARAERGYGYGYGYGRYGKGYGGYDGSNKTGSDS